MFVSDIAVFVLKRDVKLQPTNLLTMFFDVANDATSIDCIHCRN